MNGQCFTVGTALAFAVALLDVAGSGVSVDGQAEVRISDGTVSVTSTGEVSFVRVSFPWTLPRDALVLNDAWERGSKKGQSLLT